MVHKGGGLKGLVSSRGRGRAADLSLTGHFTTCWAGPWPRNCQPSRLSVCLPVVIAIYMPWARVQAKPWERHSQDTHRRPRHRFSPFFPSHLRLVVVPLHGVCLKPICSLLLPRVLCQRRAVYAACSRLRPPWRPSGTAIDRLMRTCGLPSFDPLTTAGRPGPAPSLS